MESCNDEFLRVERSWFAHLHLHGCYFLNCLLHWIKSICIIPLSGTIFNYMNIKNAFLKVVSFTIDRSIKISSSYILTDNSQWSHCYTSIQHTNQIVCILMSSSFQLFSFSSVQSFVMVDSFSLKSFYFCIKLFLFTFVF